MNSADFKLLMLCFATLWVGRAGGMTNLVSGDVTTSVTWSGTNLLEGTVLVRSNAVLTIAPGTTLLMSTGATLKVEGQLLADGTATDPIHFTHHVAGARWERILFVRAGDSRLRHCVFEYANCAGTHLDYYDNDCDPATPPLPRTYHEAVVVLAGHLEIDECTFRNLPDSSATAEGDAIAIISDDPQTPGNASAHIRNSQFLSIGQGVHSRHSYVLVENCFFTGHRGDNDDVDMYGESTPPPLIRNNVFLNPDHDDMINPTRCSAVIIGNVIAGSDDHGIVLRDKCSPIVINNLIYNCASGGIAVQNQCDALLVNNTIVNCGRGIRFFDHTGRWGSPYCLFPGSGKATVINCIIWDCPTSFSLEDSPYPQDQGSHATVLYSNVEGGQAGASVSANSTLMWGAGNLNSDPRFVGLATNNYRLLVGSPCIDAGTNASAVTTNFAFAITNDLDAIARPLDGNGDGLARFDIGAYEYLLATADSNGDGIPDGWVQRFGLNPLDSTVATGNPDNDPHTTFEEWVADTNPTNGFSYFRVETISNSPPVKVSFLSSAERRYTLLFGSALAGTNSMWTNLPGQTAIPGAGSLHSLTDTSAVPARFYRVSVTLP